VKLAIECAKLLAYCALILLLGECAWAIHQLSLKAELTLEHVNRATIAVGAAAGNLEKGSRQWELASKAQAAQSTAVLSETHATLAQIRSSVTHLDASLTTLGIALNSAIEHQDRSLLETQSQLRFSLTAMNQATVQLQKTLADTDRTISDPSIHKSLDSLAEASQNAATATQHLAATTADIQEGVHYEVKQLEAPVTKVKAVFNVALTVIRKLFF